MHAPKSGYFFFHVRQKSYAKVATRSWQAYITQRHEYPIIMPKNPKRILTNILCGHVYVLFRLSMNSGSRMGEERSISIIFWLIISRQVSHGTRSSVSHGTRSPSFWLGWPAIELSGSASHYPQWWNYRHTQPCPYFHMGVWDLNSGPCAYRVKHLYPTEQFPQTLNCYFSSQII